MEKKEWFGIDRSLEISLFEYGMLVCKNWQCKEPDEWFCLVGIRNEDGLFTEFDYGYIREHELETETWIDWKAFLSYTGCTKEEWMKDTFVSRFHDLIQYYGCENFGFGTSNGFEIKEDELESYIANMKGNENV